MIMLNLILLALTIYLLVKIVSKTPVKEEYFYGWVCEDFDQEIDQTLLFTKKKRDENNHRSLFNSIWTRFKWN